jgi:hypothetical protein
MTGPPNARRLRRLTAALAIGAWLLGSARSEAREVIELESVVRKARSEQIFQPASASELGRCEALFERTLRDPEATGLEADWAQLGWRYFPLADTSTKIWVARERTDRQRGWGVYAFRAEQPSATILQAPHGDTDRFTGNVVARLFAESNYRAAAWNTVPRQQVDLAHAPNHPFTAFTRATVKTYPQVCVVQIHGFDPDRRQTLAGETADLIISNGSYAPDRTARCVTAQLQNGFPYGRVQLFPTGVGELGATTNVQGDVVRASGARFLHLEMSQPLRIRLVNDPLARQTIVKILSDCLD